jgi:hypothetical protein
VPAHEADDALVGKVDVHVAAAHEPVVGQHPDAEGYSEEHESEEGGAVHGVS